MERKSIEIKAACSELNRIEKILVEKEAEFLRLKGFKRVVLARELSFESIKPSMAE